MTQNAVSLNGVPPAAPPPFRLLFVDEDDRRAQQVVQTLRGAPSVADVERAQTLAEACARLRQAPCEMALVTDEMPDGDCLDFLGFVRQQALDLPVVVLARQRHQEVALAALKAGASDYFHASGEHPLAGLPAVLDAARRRHAEARSARIESQLRLVETLRGALGHIKHEINNPLAIISGNAQLLIELARTMELDDDLAKPMHDIEEASRRLAGIVEQLSDLRSLLTTNGTPAL